MKGSNPSLLRTILYLKGQGKKNCIIYTSRKRERELEEKEKQEKGGWEGGREQHGAGLESLLVACPIEARQARPVRWDFPGKCPQDLSLLEILQGSVSFDEMDLFDQKSSQTGVSYAKERSR